MTTATLPAYVRGLFLVRRDSTSVNRRIFRAAFAVGSVSVAVKLIATVKELSVARAFGRSDAVDAFLIAYLLPSFLVTLIAESMNQALIPKLVQVRETQGKDEAQRLFSGAMLCTVAMLAGFCCLLAGIAPMIFRLLGATFSPIKLELTLHLFYLLLPTVVFTGISSNCAAVLNTVGRFAFPAVIPVATPLLTLVGVLVFASHAGIWAVAAATLAGAVAEAVAMIVLLHRHDYRLELRWHGSRPQLLQVGGQFAPVLISGLFTSGVNLADQSMAAMLLPGSVAALAYGNKIVAVVGGLLAFSIATAVMPYFSQMVAVQDWKSCRHTLRTYVRLCAGTTVPLALVMIAGSHWLTRILFQRGAFTAHDTALVARVQAMYALQIPFYVTGRVFYRFIVSMKRNDLIMIGGALNLFLDILLNIVCMRWLGVAGIALSTSLFMMGSFAFNCFWAFTLLNRASRTSRADWAAGA